MLDKLSSCKNQAIEVVERALELARSMNAETFCRRLEHQRDELRCTHYNIAIVGGIKRGKSTLINTLLGSDNDDLSPIAYEPCTSSIVHYMDVSCLPEGEDRTPHARLFIEGRSEPTTIDIRDLREYICEENNPDNSKKIQRVEVYGHFPLLGVCALVDTPGANAVIERHGEIAFNYLSGADAVIMTTMSRQPMTNHDATMLKAVGKEARIFYVLTQMDKLRPTERPVVENYVKNEIQNYGFTKPARVYSIAAKKVHDALRSHEDEATVSDLRRKWGVQELEDELGRFITANSDTTDVLKGRIRAVMESVQNFLSGKLKENNDLLNDHNTNVEDIKKQRQEVLLKYKESKAIIERALRKFSKKWDSETKRMQQQLENVVCPKLEIAVENALAVPGISKTIGNAFGLGNLVNKHMSHILDDFAAQTHERYAKIIAELDEELGDEEDLDFFFIRRDDSGSLLSMLAGSGAVALTGYAVYSGVSAAGAVVSAVGGLSGAAAANVAWYQALAVKLGLATAASKAATATLIGSITGAVVPVIVAILALKVTGPVVRWITARFVPGKVEDAIRKAAESMMAQSEMMRDEIIQTFMTSLDDACEEKEQALTDLEEKIRCWSPEKRDQIVRQNKEIRAILDQATAAAKVSA